MRTMACRVKFCSRMVVLRGNMIRKALSLQPVAFPTVE